MIGSTYGGMDEGLLAGVWVTPKLLITKKSHPNINDNSTDGVPPLLSSHTLDDPACPGAEVHTAVRVMQGGAAGSQVRG